jgi:hypothetical protein
LIHSKEDFFVEKVATLNNVEDIPEHGELSWSGANAPKCICNIDEIGLALD